jgi:ArsR family transcriptional regulator
MTGHTDGGAIIAAGGDPLSDMRIQIRQRKAELFKALAHPLRIWVLELLMEGEVTVGQLIALTGAESSHLSQQLGVLRSSGVVVSRREGSNVYYRVRDPRTLHLMATAKEILATSLSESRELLADLEVSDREASGARQRRRATSKRG